MISLTLRYQDHFSNRRSKSSRFLPGIQDANFDAAIQWTEAMGYQGPLVLSADDTCLTAAMDVFQSGGSWYLIGMHGVIDTFNSYDELMNKGSSIVRESLATKASKCS